MSNSNYHQLIKSQEDIIKKHYSTPIYTSITRPAIIPVIKKKLNLKKSKNKSPERKQKNGSKN